MLAIVGVGGVERHQGNPCVTVHRPVGVAGGCAYLHMGRNSIQGLRPVFPTQNVTLLGRQVDDGREEPFVVALRGGGAAPHGSARKLPLACRSGVLRGIPAGGKGAVLECTSPGKIPNLATPSGERKWSCAVTRAAAVANTLHSTGIGRRRVEETVNSEITQCPWPQGVEANGGYCQVQVGRSAVAVGEGDARRIIAGGGHRRWIGTIVAVGSQLIPSAFRYPNTVGIALGAVAVETYSLVVDHVNENDILVVVVAARSCGGGQTHLSPATDRAIAGGKVIGFAVNDAQAACLEQLYLEAHVA